jgi:hypothetical protein
MALRILVSDEKGMVQEFPAINDTTLEESTDTSHEYCPLHLEQQLTTSDMQVNSSS